MKILSAFLFLVLSSEFALAKSGTGKLPPLLVEVENRYAQAQTLASQFTQTVETKFTKQKAISNGVLIFKRPNKVRWDTLTPNKTLFVSNGVKAWFYQSPFDEEDRGQYYERPASEVQTRLANALLSGSFSLARDMKFTQESPVSFTLVPIKKKGNAVQGAAIRIDPATRFIRRVLVVLSDGNRTEILLSDIKLGEKVQDSVFDFKVPPETDKMTVDN